jgi:fatty acid-binding protein DegV
VCIYSSNYGKDKLEYIKKVLMDSFNVNKENIHVRNIPPGVLIHTKPGSYGYAILIN